jgi:phosphatidylglycerophosphate synthase
MILTGVSYYLAQWDRRMLLVGILFLAINWFGDSLDGTLARYRNRLRPRYGFYVDHIVDAFGILFLIAGFGLSGYMSLSVAMAFLIAYYLLNIEIYLATYTVGVFKLSYGIWGPTELRVLLPATGSFWPTLGLLWGYQSSLQWRSLVRCEIPPGSTKKSVWTNISLPSGEGFDSSLDRTCRSAVQSRFNPCQHHNPNPRAFVSSPMNWTASPVNYSKTVPG